MSNPYQPPRDEVHQASEPPRPRKPPSQEDLEHLRLLSVFHYVAAGLFAVVALFPLLHLTMGMVMIFADFESSDGDAPPPLFTNLMGGMFVCVASFMMLVGWTLAACAALAGRRLQRHTNHTFCVMVAAFECTFPPIGIVLGVLTLIVLLRPSVKELFGVASLQEMRGSP